jgi:hypothetical protein
MNKITIGKKDFEVEERIIDQFDLLFYEENPRIYSILQSNEEPSTQKGIEEILSKMDHVKQLRLSIEQNGGIIDPLIVVKKDDNYIVLEGNSRLAAYRLLVKKDAIKWRKIRCSVLPSTISDDDIFTLLGQYHLIGRKDWSVFEQAAYLFRKKEASNLEIDILAKSVGLKKGTVEQYLRVYGFMREHNDLRPDRWSYYEEYLKNRGIKKYRDIYPDIDDTIVSQIKADRIKQAVDIRNVLAPIARGRDATSKGLMQEIIQGKTTMYDAHERFESTGKAGGAYKTIKKFRESVADDGFQKKIKIEASSSKDIEFELKKIKSEVVKLLRAIQRGVSN